MSLSKQAMIEAYRADRETCFNLDGERVRLVSEPDPDPRVLAVRIVFCDDPDHCVFLNFRELEAVT